jgi:hypothetical protein
VNDETERSLPSRSSAWIDRENNDTPQDRTVGVPAEIQTDHLLCASLERRAHTLCRLISVGYECHTWACCGMSNVAPPWIGYEGN